MIYANCDGSNGRSVEVPKEKSVRYFHSNMYGSKYAVHEVSFVMYVLRTDVVGANLCCIGIT